MTETKSYDANPALNPLEVLIGDWEMELSNTSFLPQPSDSVKAPASFEWLEHGAYVLIRMGDKPINALWLIGRDESHPDYKVLYFDNRKVSRIYEMSFGDNVWKLWRTAPNFSQRYEGKLSEDGNTITGKWEKSTDGETWEHDFDVTYTRK